MNKTAEVIIIGGGVVGCAAAYYLAKKGVKDVIVLEADKSIGHGGSSRNGGGVRQSGRDIRELPYAMYAIQNMWPHLSEELGVDVEYYQKGNLRLGKTEAHLKKLNTLATNAQSVGLDVRMVDGKEVVPLQVLKELLPDPASLGPRTVGKTNIGCIFNGIKDGKKKSIYIYNVCDHQECYKEVESQAVSYTTGVPAMIGSMMVVTGLWKKPGVFNLEEMDPDPYMEALNKFGLPWKVVENPVSVDCYKTADPSVHMD